MTRIAVVGASGVVGREMLELLEGVAEFSEAPVAFGSERSAGSMLPYGGGQICVEPLSTAAIQGFDIALFSAGGGVSREWGPQFAEAGAVVIDNSSAFRMDPSVPLVVPEINGAEIPPGAGIIANPNCSTIILLLALAPLRQLGDCDVIVSTYQAVSGAGRSGLDALARESGGEGFVAGEPFPFPIDRNLFPLIGDIDAQGYATEERKMVEESRKILGAPDLALYVTCVRVPVERCHSEAVTLRFTTPVALEDARLALAQASGVELLADPLQPPTPLEVCGQHPVRVGRLRQPDAQTLEFWVVGDQLLKGAALNAVQIARAWSAQRND